MSNRSLGPTSALDRGRAAFARKAWSDAYALLTSADRERSLAPNDVASLAMTCHLIGRDAEGLELLARAHHAFLEQGDAEHAGVARGV